MESCEVCNSRAVLLQVLVHKNCALFLCSSLSMYNVDYRAEKVDITSNAGKPRWWRWRPCSAVWLS